MRCPTAGGKDLPLSRAEISVLQARVVGIRGPGSAALSLAYVAAGRFDAMICRNLNQWDIAAGILLVREAGGFVADPDGEKNPMDTGNILATNARSPAAVQGRAGKARAALSVIPAKAGIPWRTTRREAGPQPSPGDVIGRTHMTDLHWKSAAKLVRGYARKKFSPVEVAQCLPRPDRAA